MKHILDKIVDTRFNKDMLNTNAMLDIEGKMKYVWPFKNKILGNGFKYNENYIHNWKPHSTQD
jgi:hypothetical protein